ncbi:MAG: MT-A70 family methyltransferase [Planctomycetaceae bacterium]
MGKLFSTIYADPPWPYSNTASRAAAETHYRTMTLDAIRNEPVKSVAAENSHLHLWTTNAFLRDAFDVMHDWGFKYKSCLIWVKPQLGMGNYWRVSHEYLLFGIRGDLPFRSNKVRSWQSARRTAHSRKPFLFRGLIEQVSPGPYLELYGREEQPNSEWTVYGNQVERRLF